MTKIRITEVVEWSKDAHLMDGDASTNSEYAILKNLVEEIENKKETEVWQNEHLPIEIEIDDDDIDDTDTWEEFIQDRCIEYINENICEYNYLKAAEVDWEKA